MEPVAMNRLNASVGGTWRNVVEGGKTWFVAPVVAVTDGVLNGELVRSSVLARNLEEWQGTPLTINHPPKDLQSSISKTHEWVRQNSIGEMRGVHVSNSRLKGELWIPEGQGGEVDQIVSRMKSGKVYEVSVGFLSIMTGDTGVAKGKRFREVTQEAAPNHIALLPTELGACSIADGCGAPRAAADTSGLSFSGTEDTAWAAVDHSFAAYVAGASKALGIELQPDVAALPAEAKVWIASKTLLGDPLASTEAELLRAPVVNPATDRLNRGAVTAVFSHRIESLPLPSERKHGARSKAASLLTEHFGVPIASETAQERDMEGKLKVNGKRLGASLSAILQERAVNAEARRGIITRLASAADIEEKRVKAIIAGDENFTEDRVLKAFANVLEVSSGLLFVAAMDDVGDFMAEAAPQPTPEPAPVSNGSFFSKALSLFKACWPGDESDGGKQMTRCDLEARIKAASEGFTDDDARSLKGLSGVALKAFATGLGIDVTGFEPTAAPTTAPVAAPAVAAPVAKSEDAGSITRDELVAALKENNAQLLETLRDEQKTNQEAAERESLTASAKAAGLSDEDIKATPLPVLRKIVGNTGSAVYAGAVGAAPVTMSDAAVEARIKAFVDSPNPYDADLIESAQERFRVAPGRA